jgi:hypothetical protein
MEIIPSSPIQWKGLTFQQVVNTLKKNTNNATKINSFFRTPPLKVYRRTVFNGSKNERQSATIGATIEQPGGTFKTNVCNGSLANGIPILTIPLVTSGCNAPSNALKRVKSAGMIRNTATYNVNSYQYLSKRDRTFSQNQFNYIVSGNSHAKPGSSLATNNVYQQNTSGSFEVTKPIVIFKPNNAKYGQQGGVSSSSRIERLKYDTMQTVAKKYKDTYGTNSQSYRVGATYGGTNGPQNGTTFGPKDKYNVPTPQITDVDFSTNHNRNIIPGAL